MKVLAAIVVPPHLSASGGAKAGEQLSAALAADCEMHIASMMGAGASADAPGVRRIPVATSLPSGIPWSRVPHRYATLFYRSDIPDIVRTGRFDLVHLHNPMPALEMERIAGACRRAGTPYVVSTHGFNEVARGHEIYGFGPGRRLAWRMLVRDPVGRVARGAAAVFALSPADIPILLGMGCERHAVRIVPNGVPLPVRADPIAEAELCRRLGVPPAPDGRLTCLFLANHTPNKGLPVLLEAFASLRRPYRLIVGGERRPDVAYEAAQARTGRDQEILVTGRLSDEEIAALMRRSDLFVFPTLADTLPLVVLEAMSHGLPVIASDVGGIPFELDGGAGLLVPAGDAAALAKAVDDLGRDAARRLAMGRCGARRVAAHFTWQEAARGARLGYEQVLARGRGHARPQGWRGTSRSLAFARGEPRR